MKNIPFIKAARASTGRDIRKLLDATKKARVKKKDLNIPVSIRASLCTMLKALLNHENTGNRDDFFVIGENSIKAVQMLSKLDTGRLSVLIEQKISNPFDPSNDYMLRASLLASSNNEYMLLFMMYHIAADG